MNHWSPVDSIPISITRVRQSTVRALVTTIKEAGEQPVQDEGRSMNFFSPTWIMTLALFCVFAAGGAYLYQQMRQEKVARDFQICIDHANDAGSIRETQDQNTLCQILYSQNISGRYDAHSNVTISLAMVKRPIFNNRY